MDGAFGLLDGASGVGVDLAAGAEASGLVAAGGDMLLGSVNPPDEEFGELVEPDDSAAMRVGVSGFSGGISKPLRPAGCEVLGAATPAVLVTSGDLLPS